MKILGKILLIFSTVVFADYSLAKAPVLTE